MGRQPEADRDPGRANQKEAAEHPKRTYRTPRLIRYGNLRQLSLVKGGTRGDGGGVPVSRV